MVDSGYDNTTLSSENTVIQEEATNEQTISAYFVLFSALLAVVMILSQFLHDHPRIASIIPESGMIIMTGLFFGAIINLFAGEDMDTTASVVESGDVVNAAANDTTHVTASSAVATSLLSFSPEVFFLVLLPPIIFNSGYHLRKELFFRHFAPICLFAVVGTTISALVIATVLQIACQFLLHDTEFLPTFTELLTFGGLLSATDPVSTLAVFQAKRVDPQLFYLVFGESVLNDAVGLVLFNAFAEFVVKDNGAGKVAVDMSEFVLGFLYNSVGSPLLGLFFGLSTALLFKKIDMRRNRLLELSLFVLIVYVPFLVAQLLALSGIVTILFTGLAAKAYVVPNLSQSTADHADILFRLASHLAETAIFLELGLSVFSLQGSIHGGFILWTIIACLVARAANVYPITCFFNRNLRQKGSETLTEEDEGGRNRNHSGRSPLRQSSPSRLTDLELTNLPQHSLGLVDTSKQSLDGKPEEQNENQSFSPRKDSLDGVFSFAPQVCRDMNIAPNTAHMLWFSGLRGAVAYACVRSFPDTFGHANDFTMTTMIVVLVSVFALGSTTECMLNALRIEMNVDENAYMENWYYEPTANSCFVRLENMLHRFVVREASQSGRSMGAPDDLDLHSCPTTDEDGGEVVRPSLSPGRKSLSPVRHELQQTGESPSSAQYENCGDDDDAENESSDIHDMDPTPRRIRKQESVFDYGA